MITIFCLVLLYSTIAPLMTLFGVCFFFFKYFVDKHNMLYVYQVDFESNGMTVNVFIRYTLIGIAMFNVKIALISLVCYSTHNFSCRKYIFEICFTPYRSNIFRYIIYLTTKNSFMHRCISFLITKREFVWLNKILHLDCIESFNESQKYIRQSQPLAASQPEIESILQNAYEHPCETYKTMK